MKGRKTKVDMCNGHDSDLDFTNWTFTGKTKPTVETIRKKKIITISDIEKLKELAERVSVLETKIELLPSGQLSSC